MKQGLPSMYAKMGFKKGWAAYRKAHSGKSHSKKSHSKKSSRKKYHYPTVIESISGPAITTRRKGFMNISKNNLQALKDKVSRAMKKAREMKSTTAGETLLGLGEGIGAGFGSSWLVGVIPVPKILPKPGLWKSLAQTAAGIGSAVGFKNKHVRAASLGVAGFGLIGVGRELFRFPAFAGEVDESIYGNAFEQAGEAAQIEDTAPAGGFDAAKVAAESQAGNAFETPAGNAFETPAGNAFEVAGAAPGIAHEYQ